MTNLKTAAVVSPVWVAAITFAACVSAALAEAPPKPITKRPAWTTSRIAGTPEPPLPYVTERVFPALQFKDCVDITSMPGSDRLFVVEQSGKIFSFPSQPQVSAADLAIDLAKSLPGVQQAYAMTFHPEFAKNRFCYICYIKGNEQPDGSHVARFRVSDTNPPTIDVASEKTVITWLSGGHNGCALKFGPDGYLYISTGDGAGPNPPDTLKTGQDVSDLLSSILRVDVDHAPEGQGYQVPPNNPFVGQPGVRPEIWAYGLRNPWRMSFDRQTGDLWVGDVGWELWEMLYRVERGGNYGWAVTEGRQSTNPEWSRGPTPILPPTIDHSHTESSSITDGLTYYGSRLKALHGYHLYSDYDTGKFWGFRYENGKVVDHRELADTTHRVVGMGEAPDGECLILDHTAGTIHRLVPNPQPNPDVPFPLKLSDSGLFADLRNQVPVQGVVSYAINAEPWSDHAVANRFVALPGQTSIEVKGATFAFPKDAVLVKTLSLELKAGDPASRQRVETQLLHYNGLEWKPYTYQWNDEQSDALLVGNAGAERKFEIADPAAPGGRREQTWRFSSRAECARCHNNWSGPVLAFQPPQLALAVSVEGSAVRQLDAFWQSSVVDKKVPLEGAAILASPRDSSATLEARARAYLHVNCAHCHRLHAGGAVLSHMHVDLPLEKSNMVGARPSQGTFGIHAAQVIAPGDPWRSVLLYRISKLGGGRMPHIGSSEVDRDGVRLISDWIQQMPAAAENAGSDIASRLRNTEQTHLNRLKTASDAATAAADVNQLLSSTSGALLLLHAVERRDLPSPADALAKELANRHTDVSVRDLFEQFLPSDQRIKRLGSVIQPAAILALTGETTRGRRLFFESASLSCKNCHRIQNEGKGIGPDLTTIGKTLNRVQLLESILEPSKRIDPKYVTHLAELSDGRLVTGLLISKDATEVVLKDAQDKILRLPVAEVEQLVPQQQSLMPELQLRDMTAQQAADLLEYLSSLK